MSYSEGLTAPFSTMATFLHVGCGNKRKNSSTRAFDDAHWQLVRLDIDLRVKPDGFMVITCPDLQAIATLIAVDKLMQAAYTSAAGLITPQDTVYGLQKALASKNPRTAEAIKAMALAHFPAGITASGRAQAVPADAS